jgi:hypothetical protein
VGYLGKLQKMEIAAYKEKDFSDKPAKFSVFINPEEYSTSYKICYNDVQAQGSSGGSPAFNKMFAGTVKLKLVFDGTGVVPGALPGLKPFTEDGIKKQLKDFKEIVMGYDGEIHSPRFLELSWGTLAFRCRMTTLDITYTLFKPDGTPLRARADTSFTSYTAPKALKKEANDSSPDLSHLVTVKAGDTLPLLCHRIYGSSDYYRQVAEINGLAGFRALAVGARLLFPPLRGPSK